jgi:DNA invertase Pin-like site-specific DNA recombinase
MAQRRVRQTPKNPKAVVVYARVSTEEQGKSGLGIEAQVGQCHRLIKSEGLHAEGTFTEVISGKVDPYERPQFQKAIALANETGASLMIAKLDRLSREVYHVSRYLHDSTTPRLIVADRPHASEFEINIIASLAQEERRLISERTKSALAVRREQGMNLGQAGRQVAAEKAREFTEDAITRAKELKSQGLSLSRIAVALNAEGFVTSRGSEWTKQALSNRLKVTADCCRVQEKAGATSTR